MRMTIHDYTITKMSARDVNVGASYDGLFFPKLLITKIHHIYKMYVQYSDKS